MTPEIEARLLNWYEKNARSLPWRRSRELYPVLVSELMLQQTTVAAVVPLYLRWMDRFPNLPTLAKAEVDEVMQAWSGLGYYSRARRLHLAAQLMVERETLPSSLQELMALPGLGPYTAAAVASIALGLPHLALDTNALRVLLRLYGWSARADSVAVQDELRRRVESALPHTDFGITNQALMELGASLCKVRKPSCLVCPWAGDCQAHARGIEEAIPLPKPKKAVKVTPVRVYLVGGFESGCLLLRGTPLGLLGDLHQPPLDFGAENPAGSSWSELTEWLGSYPARPLETLSYGISGRKLQLELLASEAPLALALQRCEEREIPAQVWTVESQAALSSLTRKILKGWRESPSASPLRDRRCPESEL